ncbi:ATP-dependent DNA helicase RecQ [Arcobacter nitrofigilis DSM 7299]|uniref:DNA helicase RecQ n=1 Tax=Arcobacter nitrofigilis (strain ATCC 33309 / DSM 7299 / CCUG 15893 / LMG 7604 / NCTC 12251 / CI) TaxID=572480 RepID=D5V6U0_ARCNC|nr:DNA helicase RecQ [Arcobacter nitrofigilis]ADG94360.1 ATP-dependent DNA helicase RecQ [Arcobacter nitrofigilis DSM 7299]
MNNKHKILKDIFGHEHFRSFQEEVVDSIINKQDVLTILPTGGGKSLCYQLPTLLMSGTTVVISPLIALMQDQIKALNDLDIKADMISSSQTNDENGFTMQKLLRGELKFIYVAPERFTSNDFVGVLQRININYFVIDEAHCVSAWGHEFRAEYRNLDKLKRLFPDTAIAAFTATATKKVEADIASNLNLQGAKHFRAKTIRNNLDIKVEPRISNGKKQILSFLKAHKGLCGIIYTFTRKEAESTAQFLCENGYTAKAYHAGLSPAVKDEVYDDFVYEKIDIVVATIAFGMGIDKSNIRFVIHTSLPKTLENYYQEIGRAGRDGDMSYVYLLYSKSDEVKRKIQIEDAIDTGYKQTGLDKLEAMYRYCVSNNCRHKIIANYFEDECEDCKTLCDNCTKGDIEQVDVSIDVQKFLSAVYRSGQRFGVNHIIDILRGSKNQKLLEFAHDKLSVYGLGADKSKNEWVAIADKLIDIQALNLGEFRALKISTLGMEILKGNEKVLIDSDKLGIAQKIEEEVTELSFDEELYEKFRTLRREIAQESEVPAYVIFGDKTLKELASKLPLTKEEILDINGVGLVKYEKYGESFLTLCKSIKEEFSEKLENKAPLKKLTKTYLETFELIQDGKTVEEIAQIRDLGLTSILSHVSVLSEHEKISKEKKEELLKPLEIPFEIKQWIEQGLKYETLKELRQYLYLYDYMKKENN